MVDRIRCSNNVIQRFSRGLKEYAVISAYLYVCFGSLLLYKAAILRGYGIEYAPYGLAVAKALILGKFILIGRHLGVGAHIRNGTLIHAIIYNAAIFLVLLVGLSIIEEAIVGFAHHRTMADLLAELEGGKLGQVMAASLLLLLILIPYFGYKELDMALGEGKLLQLLQRRA